MTESLAPLATRRDRLVAALADTLILLAIVFPVGAAMGGLGWLAEEMSLLEGFLLFIASQLFFLLVNGHLLKTYGQTLGKRMVGIKIVDLEGAVLSFGRVYLRRYLLIGLIIQVPVGGDYFALIDCLFIFGAAHRCIHDYIAETNVVIV